MRASEHSITDRLRILFVFSALLLLPLPLGVQEQTDPATRPSTSDAPSGPSATDLQPSIRNEWQTGKQHIDAGNTTDTKQYLLTLVGADRSAKKTVPRLLLAVHHLNKRRIKRARRIYSGNRNALDKRDDDQLRNALKPLQNEFRTRLLKTTKSYLASMKRQRKEENPR